MKSQYRLGDSGHVWWLKFVEALWDVMFVRSRGDSGILFRLNDVDNRYDYVGAHIDDSLIVVSNTLGIFESLKELYNFKSTNEPSYHLVVDYHRNVNSDGMTVYQPGSVTYVTEAIKKIKYLLTENEQLIPYPRNIPCE